MLFRGSRDGFTSDKFHELCDRKGPTITIIRSATHGKIFGGYESFGWESRNNIVRDPKAFIFSVTHKERFH